MARRFQHRKNRKESQDRKRIFTASVFVFAVVLAALCGGCDADKKNEPNGVSSNVVETSDKSVGDESNDVSPVVENLDSTEQNASDEPKYVSAIAEYLDSTDQDVDSTDQDDDALDEDSREAPQGQRVTIERCVDGDTLIVRYGQNRERVRLIGVNTPETVKENWPVEPFGPEASAYTKRRVEETGGVATLVSDGDPYDKYKRKLAFVYLGDETISLNEDLARQGLGKVELFYNYSHNMKDRLQKCADLAKSEKLGIYTGEASVAEKPEAPAERRASVQGERVRIERVLNADTLIAQGGVKVQLNGINAPEKGERFGSEATAYVQNRVASVGAVATLVSDGDPYDRYGRKLAFVYLGSDTTSLNEDLARQGLAEIRLHFNYSQEMKNRLQNCADMARRERLGIYSGR